MMSRSALWRLPCLAVVAWSLLVALGWGGPLSILSVVCSETGNADTNQDSDQLTAQQSPATDNGEAGTGPSTGNITNPFTDRSGEREEIPDTVILLEEKSKKEKQLKKGEKTVICKCGLVFKLIRQCIKKLNARAPKYRVVSSSIIQMVLFYHLAQQVSIEGRDLQDAAQRNDYFQLLKDTIPGVFAPRKNEVATQVDAQITPVSHHAAISDGMELACRTVNLRLHSGSSASLLPRAGTLQEGNPGDRIQMTTKDPFEVIFIQFDPEGWQVAQPGEQSEESQIHEEVSIMRPDYGYGDFTCDPDGSAAHYDLPTNKTVDFVTVSAPIGHVG